VCWTVFFPRGNIRQWVDVWILAVAQAEGLVMPTNKNMKTTYQDKQTWHGIFSFSSIFDAGADQPWARTSQLGGMRCSGSAEVKLMGPLPGWHDWKRIGHFVS